MTKHIRNRHFFISDLILLTVASYFAFVLRLETRLLGNYRPGFALFTVLVLVITPTIFRIAGVYTRYWRYASVEELLLLSGAVAGAALLAGVLSVEGPLLLSGVLLVPRSIPFIFGLLALVATAGPRLIARLATSPTQYASERDGRHPVLIMGAGDAGRMIVRELRQNMQLGMQVVGFLDDDPAKLGVRIHGVQVLGTRHDIPRLAVQSNVERVLIAMPTAPGKVIREIVDICERAGVIPKTMPGIYELLADKVMVNQLRDVQIEDLLRRAPVQTDVAAVAELIRGKRVMVTGGGGSIGSELCRQILRRDPAELVIVGHGENSVFEIHNELGLRTATAGQNSVTAHGGAGSTGTPARVVTVIADIRFRERIEAVFGEHRPQIVFHAAAHKHVPLMELNPSEAITNNVIGTRNLLEAAQAVGVERFVMLSTDKAVNPTSIMGASKRAAELLVLDAATKSGRPYAAVRFGNVLGSRGSVVHAFKKQIAAGGPVCVTHAEMQRYFMTIPEAVQLVLQAAVMGQSGAIFVLDMGDPVKIMDLARDMIELSGLEVGHNIEIAITGTRPGEKLYEELFVDGEAYDRTKHEKVFVASNASKFVPPSLHESIERLHSAAVHDDPQAIRLALQYLLPEYQPEPTGRAEGRGRDANEHVGALSLQLGTD